MGLIDKILGRENRMKITVWTSEGKETRYERVPEEIYGNSQEVIADYLAKRMRQEFDNRAMKLRKIKVKYGGLSVYREMIFGFKFD